MDISFQFGIVPVFVLVGAALVAAGLAMWFTGTEKRGQRAAGASIAAVGLMMWLLVVFITPTSTTSTQGISPEPVVTQQVK